MRMNITTPRISMRNLTITRSKGDARFILSVPSFQAASGDFVAVTGESGCGKSTFLDILGLVLAPSAAQRFTMAFPGQGGITVRDIHRADDQLSRLRRRHIGYVLQTGGLLPFLSVAENIHLPLRLQGRHDTAAVRQLADTLGITDQLAKKPSELSGGQRQRAAIARALIHKPGMILADEPTAAVDHAAAVDIMTLLRKLTSRDKTLVILVTHDTGLAATVANRHVGFQISRLRQTSRAELTEAS